MPNYAAPVGHSAPHPYVNQNQPIVQLHQTIAMQQTQPQQLNNAAMMWPQPNMRPQHRMYTYQDMMAMMANMMHVYSPYMQRNMHQKGPFPTMPMASVQPSAHVSVPQNIPAQVNQNNGHVVNDQVNVQSNVVM